MVRRSISLAMMTGRRTLTLTIAIPSTEVSIASSRAWRTKLHVLLPRIVDIHTHPIYTHTHKRVHICCYFFFFTRHDACDFLFLYLTTAGHTRSHMYNLTILQWMDFLLGFKSLGFFVIYHHTVHDRLQNSSLVVCKWGRRQSRTRGRSRGDHPILPLVCRMQRSRTIKRDHNKT